MRARKWVMAASALGVVLAMPITLRQMSGQPAAAEPGEPPESKPDERVETRAVRVEHEFITLVDTAPVESDPVTAVRTASVRALPHVRRARNEPKADAEKTLAEKTRRALLGDGRYRPEPFPRAR